MSATTTKVTLPSLSTFLSFLFGTGGPLTLIIGALNLGSMSGPIDQIVTGSGALLTAIAAGFAHNHVSKKALTTTSTTATITVPKGA